MISLRCRNSVQFNNTRNIPQLDRLFTILSKVADDQVYANGSSLDDILNLQLHDTLGPFTGSLEKAGASVENGHTSLKDDRMEVKQHPEGKSERPFVHAAAALIETRHIGWHNCAV